MILKTIEQAIQAASKCLEGVGLENPRMESEFLVAAFLQIPRTHLIVHRDETLPARSMPTLRAWLKERQQRKPLAYVTREQPFRDFSLRVSPAVQPVAASRVSCWRPARDAPIGTRYPWSANASRARQACVPRRPLRLGDHVGLGYAGRTNAAGLAPWRSPRPPRPAWRVHGYDRAC